MVKEFTNWSPLSTFVKWLLQMAVNYRSADTGNIHELQHTQMHTNKIMHKSCCHTLRLDRGNLQGDVHCLTS